MLAFIMSCDHIQDGRVDLGGNARLRDGCRGQSDRVMILGQC